MRCKFQWLQGLSLCLSKASFIVFLLCRNQITCTIFVAEISIKFVFPTFKLDLQISTALALMFAQDFGNFQGLLLKKPELPNMFLLWIPKPPELLRKNSDSWAARVLRSSAIWAANDKDSFRRIYINFSTKNHRLLSKQILVHFRRSHPKVPVSDVISLNP